MTARYKQAARSSSSTRTPPALLTAESDPVHGLCSTSN